MNLLYLGLNNKFKTNFFSTLLWSFLDYSNDRINYNIRSTRSDKTHKNVLSL